MFGYAKRSIVDVGVCGEQMGSVVCRFVWWSWYGIMVDVDLCRQCLL